jgi:hypothetical protein
VVQFHTTKSRYYFLLSCEPMIRMRGLCGLVGLGSNATEASSGSDISRCKASNSWCRIADASAACDRFIQNRTTLHFLDVLAKVADRQLLGDRDRALVGDKLPRATSGGESIETWAGISECVRGNRRFVRG